MMKYQLLILAFIPTIVLANDFQPANCPTQLTPQKNGTYTSNEFPGWKSDWYKNKISPPLTGKDFSHTWIVYAPGTTYQVYCLYNLGKDGLSMRMTMNKPVNDIEQTYPKNWRNGSCFKSGEEGIKSCSFTIR